MSMSRRRDMRSAQTPATSTRNVIGTTCTASTRPSSAALPSRPSSTAKASAIGNSESPMTLTACPVNRRRKSRWRRTGMWRTPGLAVARSRRGARRRFRLPRAAWAIQPRTAPRRNVIPITRISGVLTVPTIEFDLDLVQVEHREHRDERADRQARDGAAVLLGDQPGAAALRGRLGLGRLVRHGADYGTRVRPRRRGAACRSSTPARRRRRAPRGPGPSRWVKRSSVGPSQRRQARASASARSLRRPRSSGTACQATVSASRSPAAIRSSVAVPGSGGATSRESR